MDGLTIGIIGGFITTWGWIAALTLKVGEMLSMRDKVNLMFAKMFDGVDNDEIHSLKSKLRELEKSMRYRK